MLPQGLSAGWIGVKVSSSTQLRSMASSPAPLTPPMDTYATATTNSITGTNAAHLPLSAPRPLTIKGRAVVSVTAASLADPRETTRTLLLVAVVFVDTETCATPINFMKIISGDEVRTPVAHELLFLYPWSYAAKLEVQTFPQCYLCPCGEETVSSCTSSFLSADFGIKDIRSWCAHFL